MGHKTVLAVSKEKSKELIRMTVDFGQPREATFCFARLGTAAPGFDRFLTE